MLGTILVEASDATTTLPSAGQRRLLAILAVHAPEPVRSERLADLLELTPSGLRTSVTRLRRVLGEQTVLSPPGGYRLTAAVDASAFTGCLAAPASNTELRWQALEDALALWRGPALDEFAHEEWATGAAARLTELHAAAAEDHAEGLVTAQRWSDAIAELSAHIARHPLRDRPRGLLMRALAGDGRQADALQAFRDYRQLLVAEIGTEPSAAVRAIEERIAGGWTKPVGPEAGGRAPRTADTHELPTPLRAARRGLFVGRDAVVDDLYAGWRGGAWRTLIVAGEPGIGKSRLLAELAHRMHEPGRRVAMARGDADFAVSYRPWTELLGPIVRSLPSADIDALGAYRRQALARVLPDVLGPPESTLDPAGTHADAWRSVLLDAILSVLRRSGRTVLVLDDLHCFDAGSLAIARRVVAAALPELTVIGAYRDTDVPAPEALTALLADLRRGTAVRRLVMDGIDGAAVVRLVERAVDRPLDAATISLGHAIHARTAGNPLFAGELIAHLVTRPTPIGGTPAPRRELPAGLAEIIRQRLSGLGDEALSVLRVAAAVGVRFDVRVVEETVALDRDAASGAGNRVLDLLERACAAGVVVEEDDGMSFRHAVIRSALIEPMSVTRRQRLHRDIAAVLERMWAGALDRHLQVLAYHHDRAGSPDSPRWYQRAADAAVRALDAGAADLAERGLALLGAGEDVDAELRCDLLIARAAGLRLAGRETVADARQAADAAVESPGLRDLAAQVDALSEPGRSGPINQRVTAPSQR